MWGLISVPRTNMRVRQDRQGKRGSQSRWQKTSRVVEVEPGPLSVRHDIHSSREDLLQQHICEENKREKTNQQIRHDQKRF